MASSEVVNDILPLPSEQDISNKAANTVARGLASFIFGNVYDAEYPLVFFLLDIVRF